MKEGKDSMYEKHPKDGKDMKQDIGRKEGQNQHNDKGNFNKGDGAVDVHDARVTGCECNKKFPAQVCSRCIFAVTSNCDQDCVNECCDKNGMVSFCAHIDR